MLSIPNKWVLDHISSVIIHYSSFQQCSSHKLLIFILFSCLNYFKEFSMLLEKDSKFFIVWWDTYLLLTLISGHSLPQLLLFSHLYLPLKGTPSTLLSLLNHHFFLFIVISLYPAFYIFLFFTFYIFCLSTPFTFNTNVF